MVLKWYIHNIAKPDAKYGNSNRYPWNVEKILSLLIEDSAFKDSHNAAQSIANAKYIELKDLIAYELLYIEQMQK